MIRILGIDPGLQRTGWGMVGISGNQLSFIGGGVIAPSTALAMPERLRLLHDGLTLVAAQHSPVEASVEETFVNANNASSLKLGQARGAILLSLSLSGIPSFAYAANVVKKAVVGAGHADKTQVAHMVKVLLPGCRDLPADAMDALAIAITHAHHRAHKKIEATA